MSKYGKLILEGLGVVLAAGVIISLIGAAQPGHSGVDARTNIPNQAQAATPDSDTGQTYACPMHPDHFSHNPNDTCSICGMKYQPVGNQGGDGSN
jgi:hypothetical protein